jgi:hypothetical protein
MLVGCPVGAVAGCVAGDGSRRQPMIGRMMRTMTQARTQASLRGAV